MHDLRKLGYDNWNDALDSYLDYKKRNKTKNNLSFDEWYSFKTRVKNIHQKIKTNQLIIHQHQKRILRRANMILKT